MFRNKENISEFEPVASIAGEAVRITGVVLHNRQWFVRANSGCDRRRWFAVLAMWKI
mgnify:CR=1 FL=1